MLNGPPTSLAKIPLARKVGRELGARERHHLAHDLGKKLRELCRRIVDISADLDLAQEALRLLDWRSFILQGLIEKEARFVHRSTFCV